MTRKYAIIAALVGMVYRQIELLLMDFYVTPKFHYNPIIWILYGVYAVVIFLLAFKAMRFLGRKLSLQNQALISLLLTFLSFIWISLSLNLNLGFIHGIEIIDTLDWFFAFFLNLIILLLPGVLFVLLIPKIINKTVPNWEPSNGILIISSVLIAAFLTESIMVSFIIPYNQKTVDHKLLNVILISVDTLRRDHISLYGYPRETTPNLDKFFKTGVRFNRCITAIPETGPSYTSIFTSTFPFEHQVFLNGLKFQPHNTGLTTISNELRQAGYYTSSHLSWSVPGTFTNLEYGIDDLYQNGVKVVYSKWVDFRTAFDNIGALCKTIIDQTLKYNMIAPETALAVNWLDSRPKEPFYTHIYWHYPHDPYGDRAKKVPVYLTTDSVYYEPYSVNDPDSVKIIRKKRNLYDSDIFYTDVQIAAVLDAIERNGYLENSIIIFTADHGEELGARLHEGEPYLGHSLWLYESSTNVPLIFHLPEGFHQSEVVESPVSTVDIAPTILTLLRLPCPESMKGIPLFTSGGKLRDDLAEIQPWVVSFITTRNPANQRDYSAIYEQNWTLLRNENYGEVELYNINEDYHASNNLIMKHRAEARSMESNLSQLMEERNYEHSAVYPIIQKFNKVPVRILDKLHSLGYVK